MSLNADFKITRGVILIFVTLPDVNTLQLLLTAYLLEVQNEEHTILNTAHRFLSEKFGR